MICSECDGSGIIYDDDLNSGKMDCQICDGTGIYVKSSNEYEALQKWAMANGWVKVQNVET